MIVSPELIALAVAILAAFCTIMLAVKFLQRMTQWSCKFCRELISASATVCPHCRREAC